MEGRSLLFTQLAPWKGLLNMKYEESGENWEEKREGSQVCGGGEGGKRPSQRGS